MPHLLRAAALLAALAVTACAKDSSDLTNPNSPGGSVPGGSDPSGGNPPPSNPIVPVDPSAYTASVLGSFTNTGTSYGLLFRSSGAGAYNVGTCTGDPANGTDGTWVDADGNVTTAHNSKCLDYYSNNEVGSNGKGHCIVSSAGYIGVWLNPHGHATSAYHTNCLKLGAVVTALTVSFDQPATLYLANDGSQQRFLNFTSGGTVTAQLYYHGMLATYTTGTGTISGTDNASPSGAWTIDLAQTALNWTTGLYNGDLISALQDPGVEVVACNGTAGCDLITLYSPAGG